VTARPRTVTPVHGLEASEEPRPSAHHRGADDHLELVDEADPDRLRGELGADHREVVLAAVLEPPDRLDVERPLDRVHIE
jgi:hypothetical protein